MASIFKVSKTPWSWYALLILLFTILSLDIFIYGFAGPYLISAADWFLVIVGLALCVPIGIGINLYALQVTVNKVKSNISLSADSKEESN